MRFVNQIKTLIIDRIHYGNNSPELKLSVYLSQNLNYDYTRISKLFSSTEGIINERFTTLQRLERAKELLIYDQQNTSKIAAQLDYIRVAIQSTINTHLRNVPLRRQPSAIARCAHL